MSSTSFETELKQHTFSLVIPAVMVHAELPDYIRHRVSKEIRHRCHAIGYVMEIHEIVGSPVISFCSHPFNGDMIAEVTCIVELLNPQKGHVWRLWCQPTDRRMGVSICQMDHPPIMVTVIQSDQQIESPQWLTLRLEEVRVMGRENRIRAVASVQQDRSTDAAMLETAATSMTSSSSQVLSK